MTTVIQVLEKLAQVKERSKLERMLNGFSRASKKNIALFNSLDNLKRITKVCKKKHRIAARLSTRRF